MPHKWNISKNHPNSQPPGPLVMSEEGFVQLDDKKTAEEVSIILSFHWIKHFLFYLSLVLRFWDIMRNYVIISTFQINAEFQKVQTDYYNSLIVEMKEDCETYRKATEWVLSQLCEPIRSLLFCALLALAMTEITILQWKRFYFCLDKRIPLKIGIRW